MKLPRALFPVGLGLCLALVRPVSAATDAIRIDEIGFACLSGNTAFVELVASASGQSFDAGLYLGVTNSVGDSTAFDLDFGTAAGSAWAPSRTWLVAGSQFAANTGITRDGPFGQLDMFGGTLTLFTLDAKSEPVVIDRFVWGSGPGLARAPYRGQSLQRVLGGFTVQSRPTPTPSTGIVPDSLRCYGYTPHTAWRIEELMAGCANGSKGVRFVEFVSTSSGVFDRNLRMVLRDAAGTVLSQHSPFNALAGQSVSQGTRFLCATVPFAAAVGLAPDGALPVPLDSTGGAIELVLMNATGDSSQMIDRVEYGERIGAARPRAGFSLQRQPEGGLLQGAPTPKNRSGQQVTSSACFSDVIVGHAWTIDEFGLGCRVPALDAWFVEIRSSLSAQPSDPGLGLRVRDRSGAVVLDAPAVLGATGREFELDQRFLVAASGFTTATGMTPDAAFSAALDPEGGTIELYFTRAIGGDSLLHTLRYGDAPGSTLPAPTPGGSLVAQSAGGHASQSVAGPKNSGGASVTTECHSGQPRDGLRIAEFAVACADGRPGTWFAELACFAPETFLDDRMRLSWYSRTDSLIASLPVTPISRIGHRLLLGNRILLGPSTLAYLGAAPDQALSALPDSIEGRVVLSRFAPDGTVRVLSEVRYGGAAGVLPYGASLRRFDDTTYETETMPSPQSSGGYIANQGGCFGVHTSRPFTTRQLATRCRSGEPASFLEVSIGHATRAPNDVGVTIEDASGASIADLDLFEGQHGAVLPMGARFLLGSSGFSVLGGTPRDQALPVELPTTRGAIVLYQRVGTPPTRSVLHRLDYGVAGTPAPAAGSSLVRATNGQISIDTRPRPQNLAGVSVRNACWAATDSSIRIAELGVECFLGTADVKYVEVLNLEATALLDTSLWLRLLDGAGQEIEMRRLVGPALLDRAWGAGGRLLAGTSAFITAAGFAPDVTLGTGPASDSGEVQLLWRSADAPSGVVLDVFRYGSAGAIATPPPGGAIVRAPDGSRQLSLVCSPQRLAGEVAAGSCFAYQPPHSMLLHEFGLQCAEGTLDAQYIELRSLGALRLDPGIGVEVFDAAGQRTADYAGLFADRAWQYRPAGTSFLLANTTDSSGALPDRRLSAPLDTSGGKLRVYHVGPTGQWRDLGTWAYGQTNGGVVRPPPGLALQRDPEGRLFVVESRPRRLPNIPWSLPECHRSIAPRIRISEMSLGCAYEPLDGSGRFIELQNFGETPVRMDGFQLQHGRNEVLEQVALRDSSSAESTPGGGHWLVTGEGFESANGLRPDAVTLRYVPETYWRARLYWLSHARYSPVLLDGLAIALFLDGTLYPGIPYGKSITRASGDSVSMLARPTPRNSAGQQLDAVGPCLGIETPYSPVSVAQFAASSPTKGPASAFLELTYPRGVGTSGVGIRTFDREGQMLCELPSAWGTPGVDAPVIGSIWSGAYRWLIGAIGFENSVHYRPDIELPLQIDPGGGRIEVFAAGEPETLHVRLPYGAIAPGGGGQRRAYDHPGTWPLGSTTVWPVYPLNRTATHSYSAYGETWARAVRIIGAGLACPDGESNTRYLQLMPYIDWQCSHSCWPTFIRSTRGRVRTLDRHGAPLDSIEWDRSASQPVVVENQEFGYFPADFISFHSRTAALVAAQEQGMLPPRMDDGGGTIQFVMLDPDGDVIETVDSRSYPAAPPAPLSGVPLSGSYPSFRYGNYPSPLTDCPPCGYITRALAGLPITTAPQYDTTLVVSVGGAQATRRFGHDGSVGRWWIEQHGRVQSPIREQLSTRFVLHAPESGVDTLSIQARIHVTGSVRMTASNPPEGEFQVALLADAETSPMAQLVWRSLATSESLVPVDTLVTLGLRVVPGKPFRLNTRMDTGAQLSGSGSRDLLDLSLESQLTFDGVPEGARVISCHGFGGSIVSTRVSQVSLQAFTDRIELAWSGAQAGESVRLERVIGGSEWKDIAELTADGTGRLAYVDSAIEPGQSLRYRLRRADGSTEAESTPVMVPAPNALALSLVGGQPARGALAFDVRGVRGREARLELFDVAGRRQAIARVRTSGDGPQRVVPASQPLPGGLYVARLTCDGRAIDMRLVVAP